MESAKAGSIYILSNSFLSMKKNKSLKKSQEEKSKIRIKVRSYDHRVIDTALKTIIDAINQTGAKIIGPIFLPVDKTVYTVLRSTFVHKDAREQFERRIHRRLIDILNFTPETLEVLRTLKLPAGVDIEIKM